MFSLAFIIAVFAIVDAIEVLETGLAWWMHFALQLMQNKFLGMFG